MGGGGGGGHGGSLRCCWEATDGLSFPDGIGDRRGKCVFGACVCVCVCGLERQREKGVGG